MTGPSARLSRLAARFVLRPSDQPTGKRERHATWLELFFDLVFVLALAAVVNRLGNNATPPAGTVAVAFVLFVLIQWAWVGQVFYNTRYDPDDVVHRLIVLVAMAGGGAIALGVGDAPGTLLLPIGYLLVRGTLLLLYSRVWLGGGPPRRVATIYLTGFSIGWLLWLSSLVVPIPTRPALWITGLTIEMLTPWLGIRWLSRAPVDTSHLPERIGQFTIIVLGISLTNLLNAVPARPTPLVIAAAAVALVVPASIWWVYTTFLTARLALPRLHGGQSYMYLHAPLDAALLFLGWSLGQVVRHIAHGPPALPGPLRLLLAGSIITWMLCGLGLSWISLRSFTVARLAIAVLGTGPVAAIGATVTDPVATLVLLAVTLIGYAVLTSRRIVQLQIRPGTAR